MASSLNLPDIKTVPSLPAEERAQILDILFEPSTQLHTLSVELLGHETFSSYGDLVTSIAVQLAHLADSGSPSDTEWLDAILGSHPRLGEKKVESAQSQAEQAQLKSGSEEESQKLADLNIEYEKTFPGLRYVVFVNGRSRPEIMKDMQIRIDRDDIKQERLEAIKAMCDIAIDRAHKLKQI